MTEPLLLAGSPAPPTPRGLLPEQLRRRCDLERFDFETTAGAPPLGDLPGQERALEALRLGLAMHKDGFNVFALGPAGLGKHEEVLRQARELARAAPAPDAWCYVHNFEDPRRPRALRLPAGRARPFARAMSRLIDELRAAIPAAFDSPRYQLRRHQIEAEHKLRESDALEIVEQQAKTVSIALVRGPTGIGVAPLGADGEVLEPDAFAKLPEDEKQKLVAGMQKVGEGLRDLSIQIPTWLKQLRDKLRALDREVTMEAIGVHIDVVRAQYQDLPAVVAHLDAVQADLLENTSEFLPSGHESGLTAALRPLLGESPSRRYLVNVLVDPDPAGGARVVVEDSPTVPGLCGHLEQRSELGAMVTDFMLLEAGALHRANGGVLILDALRLFREPYAWEELKRCLRARLVRIESLGKRLGISSAVTLEPEPIPLDVKVVLTGDRLLYYLLAEHDPEFLELFKIAADFDDTLDRTPESETRYGSLVAAVAAARGTRALDRAAVAMLVEEAARWAGDAGRLSLHVQGLGDLVDEADHRAAAAGRTSIAAADVRATLDAKLRRAARARDRLQDELRHGTLLVDTRGERIGQVNGLSVLHLGDLSFGRPSRITARVRVGGGEVIDIEREVELGGPIHSKGVLILAGYLGARYAAERPLSLSASLVFEQSYGGVEGDSASSAELCALLSALAELPIKQSLAVTGSVNQHGAIQPVGGVNEKIEGFFDACKVQGGPAPGQGVLIPASNVQHLMLRDDVVEAVARGEFAVVPVTTLDEAMALLTGVAAGEPDAEGHFPDSTVNGRVERRLAGFARKAQSFRGSKAAEG